MKMKQWDVCPECGARRVAYCRFCNTLGDRFPLADLDLILPPEHAESVTARYNSKEDRFDDDGEDSSSDAVQPFLGSALSGSVFAGAGMSLEGVIPRAAVINAAVADTLTASSASDSHGEHRCYCHGEHGGEHDGEHRCRCREGNGGEHNGEHRCRCHEGNETGNEAGNEAGNENGERKTVKRQVASCHRSMVGLSQPLDEDPEIGNDEEEYPLAVMCPCCDELLYPQFLKFCRNCGHEFPDGIDRETASQGTFYTPSEDDEDGYDEDDWEDDSDGDDSDGNGEKRSGQPESAGCCLMIIGLCLGALGFLC